MTDALNFLMYLLLTLLLLGVLIFVHELGHYLTARACKVKIYEFSIGMGKRLGGFTSKKTGIQYSLRLLPVGGYVSMAGEDEGGDGTEDPNAFHKKNVWQRILILAAGAGMNVLTGFLAMLVLTTGLTLTSMKPDSNINALPSTTVSQFGGGAASQLSGLRVGDTVLSVDGVRVHTGYDLQYEIMNSGYEPVDLVVERNGERLTLPDVRFWVASQGGVSFGSMDFIVEPMDASVGNVLKTTCFRSVSSIKMVFDSIGGIISGRYSLRDLSGPIGVTNTVSQVASQPLAGWNILYLFSLIAMNLGVMNLLPIPALDGGRLFFRLVEVFRFGKPIKPSVEARIHGVGMMLLLLLTAVIAFKDIFVML